VAHPQNECKYFSRICLEVKTVVALAYSPLVSVFAALVGGLIAYFAAGRGDRANLREQQRHRKLEFQAALRALLIEMLRGAELALSGSGTVLSWGDPSGKTHAELEFAAQAHEGQIPFYSAKYFRDRAWLKYEDVLVENLDSLTINTIDSAYSSARQVFDFVGAPLPQGATRMHSGLPYLLWRAAWDFSQAIAPTLERLTDAEEREQLSDTFQKMTSRLESQRKVVGA
jgi:hypothetical protein